MKKQTKQIIGHIRQLGLAALLTTGLASQAQTPIFEGHTDIGVAYDETANEWELHVHDEENDAEYFPATGALLVVKNAALTTVPAGLQWSFLGTAGSDTWILPKAENPNLLFLGFGAEETDAGIFVGDVFTMKLTGVTGPGNFAVYDTDAFNIPIVWMNSADGFSEADSKVLPAGAHSHVNWAFSAPGDYSVFFEASGISELNGATTSGPVEYLFQVVPEPGSLSLAGVGALSWIWLRRKQRN